MNPRSRKNSIRAASFEDTFAIGINSALADYKLAWAINKKVSIDLARNDDIDADNVSYAFYYYTAGENSYIYNLVSIKNKDQALLDFKNNIDFLMVVRNGISAERAENIVRQLCEIEGVGHAFLLDINKTKSIKQALEIIELQEIIILGKNSLRTNLENVRRQMLLQRESSQKAFALTQ
jgi:hypothetical protein